MDTANDLIRLFTKLCDILNKSPFEYCVAGGFAASMWGLPRGTVDIDILILIREKERKSLVSLLGNHFNLMQSHDNDMVFGNFHIWRHILAGENKKNIFPLDMIIASGEYLESVLERKIETEYKGIIVPVISIEDLIVFKSISFRDIDRFDIKNLIDAGNPIDWDYLDEISTRLIPRERRDFIDALRKNAPGQF
jgi:hypothetical protein